MSTARSRILHSVAPLPHSIPALRTKCSCHLSLGRPVVPLAQHPSWPTTNCFNVEVPAPDLHLKAPPTNEQAVGHVAHETRNNGNTVLDPSDRVALLAGTSLLPAHLHHNRTYGTRSSIARCSCQASIPRAPVYISKVRNVRVLNDGAPRHGVIVSEISWATRQRPGHADTPCPRPGHRTGRSRDVVFIERPVLATTTCWGMAPLEAVKFR